MISEVRLQAQHYGARIQIVYMNGRVEHTKKFETLQEAVPHLERFFDDLPESSELLKHRWADGTVRAARARVPKGGGE